VSAEPAGAPTQSVEESAKDSRASACLDIVKNCFMMLVGISLMAYGEWLSFEKEQSKREFFERQERMEDVQDRLRERLERARASRTPLDFDDIWDSFDKGVEESRRQREAERAGTAPTTSQSPRGER
jgi:hypothetical protein